MSEEIKDLLETLVLMERNNLDHLIRTGQAIKWRKSIEQLQKENKELKEKYSKLEDKYIKNLPCCNEEDCSLYNHAINTDYVLNEFEKWLEEEMKRKNSRWEQFRNQINTQELVLERLNAQIIFIDCCLNKLQELKKGKK